MPRTARKESLSVALAAANGARPSTVRCPYCGATVTVRTDGKLRRHQGPEGVCSGSGVDAESIFDLTEEAMAALDDRAAAARRNEAGPTIFELPLDRLDPDPGNPRGAIVVDSALEELAASIHAAGVLQPLVVVPGPVNAEGVVERWTIVFGHRRAEAARIAGLTTVPAIGRPDLVGATDRLLAAQLIENLQRSDLDAMSEARAFARLRDLGLTQKQIAVAVGINQGTVSKRLALLNLPDDVQALVGTELDVASAVELSRLEPQVATRVADEISGGRPAGAALSEADRIARERALEAATVDRLEALGVALVEYPRWGHWGQEREDLPLADQPEAGAAAVAARASWSPVDVDLDEHAFLPCHGATVVPGSGAALYVCLDPSRHGIDSPAVAHQRRIEEGRAAEEAASAARAAREAALAARHEATVRTAQARLSKHDLAEYVVNWTLAALAGPVDPAGWSPDAGVSPNDALSAAELLGAGVGLLLTLAGDDRSVVAADHGEHRVAYAACLAAGARYCEHVEAGGRGRGSLAVRLHLGQLTLMGGYEITEDDRYRLLGEVPPAAAVPEAPEGAVGWYAGLDDEDPPRWITDEGEAGAIASLYPERWTPVENGAGEQLAASSPVEDPAPAAEQVRCEGSGEVVIGPKGTPVKRKPAPCGSCGAEVTTDAKGRAPRHTRAVA